jgi:hypothetical protein
MTVSKAELSSLSTAVQELEARITRSGEELLGTINEGVAIDLFEVERSLRTARRRLEKAQEGLRE